VERKTSEKERRDIMNTNQFGITIYPDEQKRTEVIHLKKYPSMKISVVMRAIYLKGLECFEKMRD